MNNEEEGETTMLTKTEPVSTAPCDREESERIRVLLKEEWGLRTRDHTSISRFTEKTASSRVYRAELGDGTTVVVKQSFWFDDQNMKGRGAAKRALVRAYSVGEMLAERGVSIPRVYLRKGVESDDRFVLEYDGQFVSVLEYCEGEHFSGDKEQFRSAGAALGIFHREGIAVVKNKPTLPWRIRDDIPIEKPYEESRLRWRGGGLKNTLLDPHTCAFPEVCESFRENIALIERTMKLVDNSGVNAPGRVFGIVHNDFHSNNGLYRRDGRFSCFLDIDQLSYAPFVWDIGNTLVSLVSNALTERGEECDVEECVSVFLSGYRKEYAIRYGELLLIAHAGLRWDLLRMLRSLQRHRFENDRLSGLYPKIKTRMMARFEQIPELFAFITPEWLAKNC